MMGPIIMTPLGLKKRTLSMKSKESLNLQVSADRRSAGPADPQDSARGLGLRGASVSSPLIGSEELQAWTCSAMQPLSPASTQT